MTTDFKPQTAEAHGRLWGAKARDWAELQEPQVSPIYDISFKKAGLGEGIAYLDVGCGSGMAAQVAASRGARVSGIDASDSLLSIARERTPAGEFATGDIELLPYLNQTFDVVTGFNSIQFAGNPAVALAEARRVTRPGGSIVIATWGNPDGMQAASLLAALKPLLPTPPPAAPGPFALSKVDALKAFATSAGLTPVEVFDVDAPFSYADEKTAIRALGSSGVAVLATEISSEAAVDAAHRDAINPFRQADGSYLIKASFRCLLAST